ncbi:MAG: hypothetical protein QNK42_15890 [Pseudodonghicola sp.]|nr:hypothetical protein [Pseudodonghicola sp.]
MNKMIAALIASTVIMPTIASAQSGSAMNDAIRRGICGKDVRPVSANYANVENVKTLKVKCPASGGALDGTTLQQQQLAAGGLGLLGLGLIMSDDNNSGTTTTTTASGS